MKSWIVVSGSSPTSIAYERTNARPKIPPGRREMSFRSSASSTATEIFVALAICRSETPRRSRASRSLLPKSPVDRSADMFRDLRPMLGSRFQTVNEEADGCDARRACAEHVGDSIRGHSTDREDRHRAGVHNRTQAVEAKQLDRTSIFRCRRENGPGNQVVRPGRGAR